MFKLGRTFSKMFKAPRRLFSEQNVVKSDQGLTQSDDAILRYENGQMVAQQTLQLRDTVQIQDYVLKTVKNYFRTTYKDGLTADSVLKDHGIDSLDAVEIVMQIEEDLGYTIPAENLAIFSKVRHYINYIEHVEMFKKKYNKSPEA